MNPISTYGSRRPGLYERYRKAQRYLDDHGEPLPDDRVHTTWPKSRVALGVGAVVLAVFVALLATTAHRGGVVYMLIPIAVGILAAAVITRRTDLVPWAAGTLGLVYMIEKGEGDPDIGMTAVYGVVLLIVLELVFAAVDRATGVAWERAASVRRWLMFGGLCVVSLSAAVVVAMVGSAGRLSGAALFGFGVAAAILAVVAVVRFVRRSVR